MVVREQRCVARGSFITMISTAAPQNWQDSLGKVRGKIPRPGQEYPVHSHSFPSAVNELTVEKRSLWLCTGLVYMAIIKSSLKVKKGKKDLAKLDIT